MTSRQLAAMRRLLLEVCVCVGDSAAGPCQDPATHTAGPHLPFLLAALCLHTGQLHRAVYQKQHFNSNPSFWSPDLHTLPALRPQAGGRKRVSLLEIGGRRRQSRHVHQPLLPVEPLLGGAATGGTKGCEWVEEMPAPSHCSHHSRFSVVLHQPRASRSEHIQQLQLQQRKRK